MVFVWRTKAWIPLQSSAVGWGQSTTEPRPPFQTVLCSPATIPHLSRTLLDGLVNFPHQPGPRAGDLFPDFIIPGDGVAHDGRFDLAKERHGS